MVWTAKNRSRYDRRGPRYPSDLTNEEWAVLQPLPPVPTGQGRPRTLGVKVTDASVQDRDGGRRLVKRWVRLYPWIEAVVVDGGYKRRFIEAVQAMTNRVAEAVKRPDFAKGFVLLPKRWRVEQSIGALTASRRLKVDHESLTHVSAAAILFASITRLLASITMG